MNERIIILLERTKMCRGTQGLIFINPESINPIKLAAEEYGSVIHIAGSGDVLQQAIETFCADDCTLTGDINMDLGEVLTMAGKVAKMKQSTITILVEDIEILSEPTIKALIMAFHKTQQHSLPVAFVATGNASARVLLTNAAPYTERMFEYIEATGGKQ